MITIEQQDLTSDFEMFYIRTFNSNIKLLHGPISDEKMYK